MSDEIVIQAEGLGKKYSIGHQVEQERYSALRDIIAGAARDTVRRVVDVIAGRPNVAGDSVEEFWALRNISFDIKRGEVVGIVGRNGAGKSTLLKVLSRITEPSEGRVTITGRVASLLEVGTGFHPELSGRENIYLNGAILGMTRADINSKFDEIVAFAEVERFLDTPVKRYSSGMYVRLAFAVAAHLEPDILIVDEVLAVGDAEFQKKCLGKMKDVAGRGRTVLFVSHNMAAISSLTRSAIVLDKGAVALHGSTADAVKFYSASSNNAAVSRPDGFWGAGAHTSIRDVRLLDCDGASSNQYSSGTPFQLDVVLRTDGMRGLSCEVLIVDSNKTKIALASLSHFEGQFLPVNAGDYRLLMSFAPIHLAAGQYTLDVTTSIINQTWDHYVAEAISFEVMFSNPAGLPFNFEQSYGYGALALPFAQPTRFEYLEPAIVTAL